MKILQIIYTLGPGGAERLVVDITNELSRQGNDVSLCIFRDDSQDNFGFYKKELSETVRYINLSIPVGIKIKNIITVFKLIKEIKPDVVHCHLNLVNYVFPSTLVFNKIKFVHTIHSNPANEVSNKLEYWIRRYFYTRRKMRAVTISEKTSRDFYSYYKTSPFREIYNGRNFPKKSAGYLEVRNLMQGYRDNGETVFLHIGTCTAAKNQKMLIDVFNRLVSNGERVVLIIIGSGFDSDAGQDLKDIASEKIYFLGEKHNVSDYLYNADAFCLSSSYEGMPISLIEALACGCIPICTPVGGLVSTIKNGETGYISKSVSEDDYYVSVKSYLDNKSQIKKENLIQYYLANFSIEECVNEYLSLYNA